MKSVKFLVLFLSFCSLSLAADIEDRLSKARADKAVAEQANGYLKALNAAPEISSLVNEVNEKRKKKYQEAAGQSGGAPLQAVEQAAGLKLMEKYK